MNLKRICSLFCALSALCSVYAQHLDGSWHGTLDVGGQKLELIFQFKEEKKKKICTMDVPQQKRGTVYGSFLLIFRSGKEQRGRHYL